MKRPVGVTLIAVVNICAAIILAVGKGPVPTQQMQGAILGIFICAVLFTLGVCVGLLRLKSWARRVAVFTSWFSLLGVILRTTSAVVVRQEATALGGLLGCLLPGWTIWYLSKPEVIAAFRLRENVEWRESLNLRYRVSSRDGTIATENPSNKEEATRKERAPASVTLFGRDIPMQDPQE